MQEILAQIEYVFANAPFGVCVFDAKGTIQFANPRFCSAIFANGHSVVGARSMTAFRGCCSTKGLPNTSET